VTFRRKAQWSDPIVNWSPPGFLQRSIVRLLRIEVVVGRPISYRAAAYLVWLVVTGRARFDSRLDEL
jgi:hypothetical protein